MKRLVTWLMVFAFMLPAIPAGAAAGTQTIEQELTILVYVCGSDLESEEGEATGDIREMISSGIGNSGSVSVIMATGGASRWQQYGISSRSVQYFRVGGSTPELLHDAGRLSMGDAGTLGGFLRYGISAAPAKRYMLVLWDHGGGPVFGLCNDENHNDDSLSLAELKTGLQNGLNGRKLDIIAFDCCLMNCLDLCYDLHGIADYVVASQELVSGTGFDYDAWMRPVAANPAMASADIADSVAQTYVAENSRGRNASTATMSVIAADRMPAVMDAANAFGASLTGLVQTNLSGVIRLRNQLTSFGEFLDYDASDLVDVEDMCNAFSALLPDECAALRDAARQAVVVNYTTRDIEAHAHGLSFFMPCDTVRGDSREILNHYSGQTGAYAEMAVAMTHQVSSSGYTMTASSYTPSNFYSSQNSGTNAGYSGSFCDIWDGYYGDYCSFDDAYGSCGGDIWAGLNTESGSVWSGYSSSTGIWAGLSGSAVSGTPAPSGIWDGLPGVSATPPPVTATTASAALDNIWAGLLNTGSDYYQPGEENQNVQSSISEAVSAGELVETANAYFSSAALTSQIIYSVQLNKADLDHLSKASGVLIMKDGDEQIRLGNLGKTTIDWSTGLILSMFDGSWPMLGNQMVRADFLYEDTDGSTRFVIPARVNGLKMYLLGYYTAGGETHLLGATQGYDENGFAIRGYIALEEGMSVCPLFTAVSADGSEREYEGSAIIVPAKGLELTWGKIPDGSYLYCFGLTDLSGIVHYTDTVDIRF